LRKLILSMVVALLICSAAHAYAATIDNVNMEIWVYVNTTGNVVVYVNGVPLDDRINDLETKYDSLENYMNSVESDVYDYITLTEMRDRLVNLHRFYISVLQDELSKLNESKDGKKIEAIQQEINEHMRAIDEVYAQADEMLVNILLRFQDRLNSQQEFSYDGWYDQYGNFHHFKEVDDHFVTDKVFRIIDCYSAIGQSKVLRGDWITIEGYNSYGEGVASTAKQYLNFFDPISGKTTKRIYYLGEELNAKDFKVSWEDNKFTIKLRMDKDVKEGMKQITLVRDIPDCGSECPKKVSVTFEVVEPYIKLIIPKVYAGQPFAIGVETNLPQAVVKVDGKEYTVGSGRSHIYIEPVYSNFTVEASGVRQFDWVKTVTNVVVEDYLNDLVTASIV